MTSLLVPALLAASNYILPGVRGDIPYRGGLTLDAYAPAGTPRPAAVLVGSPHMSQLFELLDRAGYAWFDVKYRDAGDLRSARGYIRARGRFNISASVFLIAEDTGARAALEVARGGGVAGVVLFGAKLGVEAPRVDVPLLVFHGERDGESPPGPVAEFCARQKNCEFHLVRGAIHRFENWRPSEWHWKETLAHWLRQDRRGLWKNIAYARPGGRDLLLDAYIPEGPGPFPGVVLVHGGGWEAGDKTTYIAPLFAPLARAGFAWFSIDYRLTPYVRVPDQLEDVREAIRFVRRNAAWFHLDPNRIALLGESASGQMAAQVASEPCPGCEVRALVSFYGVYDFLPWAEDLARRPQLDRLFGGGWTADTLRRYSPLHHAHREMPPALLIQGSEDRLHEGTLRYAARLTEVGARCELTVLDGAPHGLENWEGEARWSWYKNKLVDWLVGALDLQANKRRK